MIHHDEHGHTPKPPPATPNQPDTASAEDQATCRLAARRSGWWLQGRAQSPRWRKRKRRSAKPEQAGSARAWTGPPHALIRRRATPTGLVQLTAKKRPCARAPERLAGLLTAEGTPPPPNTLAELRRDMARLGFVVGQIREIEAARLERLERHPEQGAHAMVRMLARVVGVGVETADLLVRKMLSRNLRDRRAVARYAGLTGAPDESGARRQQKGLARAGNARVRRGMIQLAWRFLMFQKDSALTQWYRARTADARGATRKTMIVGLARKLLIALWQLVTTSRSRRASSCMQRA